MTPETQAAIEELRGLITMSGTINMEIFYWWCTALMVVIHAGFLAYEMGASRVKNALASGVKNILAFAFIVPTFFLFGWWIYLAFPGGFSIAEAGAAGLPWSANMGPNLADNASGVFWAAFAMFAATTASILSGALIERIRLSAFIILAVLLGSVIWILGAAWGWHPAGWMHTELGFHDVAAAGCVHVIAGFFALGVVLNLGARIGRFAPDGTPVEILGHSAPMTVIGLMLIIVGFFGFLGGCIIYVTGDQWINIYGQPATLSAFAFNTLMSFAGGIIGCFLMTRDPFWMMSGGLAGIISAAAGLDVYHPALAFLIGFAGGCIIPKIQAFLVKLKVDDAVAAFAVHGGAGTWSLVACGLFAGGYPSATGPETSLYGQLVGWATFAALGFIPGFVVSYVLKMFGLLRITPGAEKAGLDLVEIPLVPYPESATPASYRPSQPGTPAAQPAAAE
jgi:ammonia channel protein AmtB